MPRTIIHAVLFALAKKVPDMLTPGLVQEIMSNPDDLLGCLEVAAKDGDDKALQSRAQTILDMQEFEPEGYHKHLSAAINAWEMYERGSVLSTAGVDSVTTNLELCERGGIVCVVTPQEYAKRTGLHVALQQQSFLSAMVSSQKASGLLMLIDEATNSPQQHIIESMQWFRAFRVAAIYGFQSLAEFERVYGKQLLAVLLDNCPVQRYMALSHADAERISKAMGEEISLSESMSYNPETLGITGNINSGKQPVMTVDELVNLDPSLQVVYMRGIGWRILKKLVQNQILPTANWLQENPQEGPPMPVDPKVNWSKRMGLAS